MPLYYRILVAAVIVAIDGILFFLPVSALFLAYVLLANPPWFRSFINGLNPSSPQGRPS